MAKTEQYREVSTRIVKATHITLRAFRHKELKRYAKSIGVSEGRFKRETVTNLMISGKATMLAQLGD